MFAATAPEVDVDEEEENPWADLPDPPDAVGQPSASSTATGSASSWLDAGKATSAAAEAASSECTPQFYDVILFDYIHEMMAGDSKKLSKLASEMWKSINSEDNALSLN